MSDVIKQMCRCETVHKKVYLQVYVHMSPMAASWLCRFNVLSEQAVSSYPCFGYTPLVNIFYMSVLGKKDSVELKIMRLSVVINVEATEHSTRAGTCFSEYVISGFGGILWSPLSSLSCMPKHWISSSLSHHINNGESYCSSRRMNESLTRSALNSHAAHLCSEATEEELCSITGLFITHHTHTQPGPMTKAIHQSNSGRRPICRCLSTCETRTREINGSQLEFLPISTAATESI